MTTDILDLREFYQSPLGEVTRHLLRNRVQALWPDVARQSVIGLGYATPLLRPFLKEAKVAAFMPPAQGGVYWPREEANRVALSALEALPLEDESVDRVIALHALENTADPEAAVREVWRVLKGNGRALFCVPHRRGFWAHNDSTPFGSGRSYSTRQLRALFKAEGFVVKRIVGALYMPPCGAGVFQRVAPRLEKLAAPLFPSFGGLLIIEASKQLVMPLMTPIRVKTPRLVYPGFTQPIAT